MPEAHVTARLILRPLRQQDAPALHRFFADPQAMRYFADCHATQAQTQNWIATTLASPPGQTREYVLEHDGAVIGKAGIWDAPELGFFLLRDQWGNGFMREALDCLLPLLHRDMGLPQITADVDPRNTPSLRLLRGLSFVETGRASATMQIGNKVVDSVYLSRAANPTDQAAAARS